MTRSLILCYLHAWAWMRTPSSEHGNETVWDPRTKINFVSPLKDPPCLFWHTVLADTRVKRKRPLNLLWHKHIVPFQALGGMNSTQSHTLLILHTVLLYTETISSADMFAAILQICSFSTRMKNKVKGALLIPPVIDSTSICISSDIHAEKRDPKSSD